ncbi:hypothetical protein DL95DRAFT_356167 [Leptodontidium sp. 2 PMI_412]|nr:hypothetical protein BKA61DRAFT_654518 [Leptodontidium sp. MPI-SDFR-AT-0119]KAH9221432.1 hypothetical protein DL95DRAFT_356167 [Leptodontidium sp. 2 PMI_412]
MALYYVYLKYARSADYLRANFGRWILTFESRQSADEFYRAMKVAKNTAGNLRYVTFHRSTPQMWCYDSTDGEPWWTVKLILEADATWNYNVMATLLSDTNGTRTWPIINNIVEGSDWFNGGAFFIRNKLIPDLFWHSDGAAIIASKERRTKFVVRGTAFKKSEDDHVLIRSDKITIEVAESTSTDKILFVGHDHGNAILVITADKYEWTFKDFFESFGVKWYTESGKDTEKQYLIYSPAISDEWELV